MRLTILTLGSRGDVQPFVALGLGLERAGFRVRICASESFRAFIEGRGLSYAHMSDELLELVQSDRGRRAVERGGRSLGLLKRAMPLLGQSLVDQWEACRDSDAIIAHPYAFGGPHIARRLGLPCIVAAPLPVVTSTAAFPNPLVSRRSLGRIANPWTHALVRSVLGTLLRVLLGSTRGRLLAGSGPGDPSSPTPAAPRRDEQLVLYGYSPRMLPDPADWPESTKTTGYWHLDRDDDWSPTSELEDFLASGPPPIYIGFGSMLVQDPTRFTQTVVEALARSGQRAILASGWGALSPLAAGLPATVFPVETVPHRWLFPRVAAVVHHGGAGTTAAGLRAGRPTLICPFVGDQAFWGKRIHELGVGPAPLPYKKITVERLSARLEELVRPGPMSDAAAAVGSELDREDGVGTAVELIEAFLHRDTRGRARSAPAPARKRPTSRSGEVLGGEQRPSEGSLGDPTPRAPVEVASKPGSHGR